MVQLIVSQSSCSKAAKMFKKSAIFKRNKVSPSMPCVAEHVTSNSGKRSDAFHSTSENYENLNRWFLLNGKHPGCRCMSDALWGRFPFNKNHRFKFSEFSLVEWNASDRFPELKVTCSATQGMLSDTLLRLKMADILNIFAALEQDDCETISCTILDSNDDVILLAAVVCFMRRELTLVNGYIEVTIPANLSGEFENHFRMTRKTCPLLTQEIMRPGRIPTGNSFGRPAILSEKQILLFLWSVANREPYSTIADRFGVTMSSAYRASRRVTEGVIDLSGEWKFHQRGCTQNVFLNFRKLFPEFLPFHSISDRKSRNFWSNGKRPESPNLFGVIFHV